MNNTTSLLQLLPQAQIGFIWGISIALTIIIVIINMLTIYIIRTVGVLKEKYGIILVAYCIVDILNGLHVTYLQLRLWVLTDDLFPTCEWRYVAVNGFDGLMYTLVSWHTVLLTFDRYIAVCYPFKYHMIMSPKIQNLLISAAWVISVLENFVPQLYFKVFTCEDMTLAERRNMDTRMQFGHLTFISIFTLCNVQQNLVDCSQEKAISRSILRESPSQTGDCGQSHFDSILCCCVILCYLGTICDYPVDFQVILILDTSL